MKFINWYITLVIALLSLSVISYLTQIHLFNRVEDTFFYMLQDMSFVPIQVLLVTLILDNILKKREKQALLHKLNMIIGVFFHDLGNELIDYLGRCNEDIKKIEKELQISTSWRKNDFLIKTKKLSLDIENISPDSLTLASLKKFLGSKRDSLLNLLANPNLLEHETFTDLLWAVFHLADELFHRDQFSDLLQTDLDHLKGDILRAYQLIIYEWLSYMNHLRKNYPYLYSIAIRTNPFNPDKKIIVK